MLILAHTNVSKPSLKRTVMNDFRKLSIWNRSIELATNTYKISSSFPKSEIYSLTSQMRRSAVSIGSNIAEGAGRQSNKEFAKYLRIAYGSACELETQVIIAKNLSYLTAINFSDFVKELHEIQKMIYSLEKNKRTGE